MPEKFPHDSSSAFLLTRKVESNLRERCLVSPGDRLLLGVSGGADSVALLYLLVELSAGLGLELEVAHFDHRLRDQSTAEARFVAALAQELGLVSHIGSWDQPQPGEEAARHARHGFLARIAQERDCAAIVLAHQLEDQIETVLFRLGRGTGIRGVLGMSWRRRGDVDIVRPLLNCRREALIAYLELHKLKWHEDPSNQDSRMSRNRIRHLALPALSESLGDIWLEHWSENLEDLRSIWSWLEASASQLLSEARLPSSPCGARDVLDSLRAEILQNAPEPVLRAALQHWLEAAGARDLGRPHIAAAQVLIENGQSGQELTLPTGLHLVLEQGRVTLIRSPHSPRNSIAAKTAKTIRFTVEFEPVALEEALRDCASGEQLDSPTQFPGTAAAIVASDSLKPPFEARRARPGERVQLLGAPGSRKIARVFQDRGIPRRLRADWPVVVDRLGVVWIPGVGVAERARVVPDSCKSLRLRLLRAANEDGLSPAGTSANLAEPGGAA